MNFFLKSLNTIAVLVALTLLSSCSSSKWLHGTWEGTGVQIDGKSWSMHLESGKSSTHIDYPSLACGGRWKIMEKGNDEVSFKEEIRFGTENCDQGCEIHVIKIPGEKNKAKVVFYLRSYFKDRPIAEATLHRSDKGSVSKASLKQYLK